MRGQAISSDFVFSLIIFTAASIIAFTMVTNSLIDREHEQVTRQAETAAALLSGEGHPQHWNGGDVLRAGLRSADQLSLRKATELADLSPARLKSVLRTTDPVYVYITNRTNGTVSLFGRCGVGNLSVNETPHNASIPALAIVGSSHPVSDIAGARQRGDDALYANLSSQDVIIIEGNITSNFSSMQVRMALEEVTARGVTIVVIGDPGIDIFGIDVNETAIASAAVTMDVFGMSTGELLSISGTVPTIEVPTGAMVSNFTMIVNASKPLYATWVFDDARIWYFGTSAGTKADGTPLVQVLGNATRDMVNVSRPQCGNITIPDAEQIAMHTRSIIHHDERLDVHVLVWRDG